VNKNLIAIRKNPRIETGLRLVVLVLLCVSGLLYQKEPQDRNWIETTRSYLFLKDPLANQKEPQDRNWIETPIRCIAIAHPTEIRKNPRIETGLRLLQCLCPRHRAFANQKEPQDRNWIETSPWLRAFVNEVTQSERTPG